MRSSAGSLSAVFRRSLSYFSLYFLRINLSATALAYHDTDRDRVDTLSERRRETRDETTRRREIETVERVTCRLTVSMFIIVVPHIFPLSIPFVYVFVANTLRSEGYFRRSVNSPRSLIIT